MHFELPDTIVEIADTSHKDNYNKVVIQKRKCVPCTAETVITLSEDVVSDASVRTAQWESARPNLDLPKIESRSEVSA